MVSIILASFFFTFPGTEDPSNHTLPVHLIKTGNNITFDPDYPNVMTFNFTVQENKTTALFVTPLTNVSSLQLLISEQDKPSLAELQNAGILFPEESYLYHNFSDFRLSNMTGGGQNQTLWSVYFTPNVSSQYSQNYTGEYNAGISLNINDSETVDWLRRLDPRCLGDDLETNCKVSIEIELEIETRSLECLYWDTQLQAWSSVGCEVIAVTVVFSHIINNVHMTTFCS